jgi:single-strand DNA-binding protein
MRGINRVVLVGNLGKDPELKILEAGTPVAKMTLATTEIYRLKDGSSHVQTSWHQIVAWRGLASLAGQYLRKGSLVYIEGKIRYRRYEDGESRRHYVTEILADQILMLDKKPKNMSQADNIKEDDDDNREGRLPF